MSTFNLLFRLYSCCSFIKSVISSIFIITSTSISEIESQLLDFGVDPKNIYVSPVLSDHYQISLFEDQYFDLLFTSGLQNRSQNTSIQGGGLYRLTGHFDNFKLSKILSSPSHGIKQVGDYIFVVNEDLGVAKLDQKLQVVNSFPLPKGLRPHGIDYCHESNNWVFACSYGDCLSIHNESFEEIDKVFFSDKRNYFGGKPQHHTNDVSVNGKLALCSMFSLSGDFKRGIYDGGVLIIDIVERKVVGSIYGDLSHPHNIQFHDSEYWILDSYTQRVLKGSSVYSCGYSSFLRGLDFLSDGTLLLGQSKNRNFSAISDTSTRPSFLDTSIVVLSPIGLLPRHFHYLPQFLKYMRYYHCVNRYFFSLFSSLPSCSRLLGLTICSLCANHHCSVICTRALSMQRFPSSHCY